MLHIHRPLENRGCLLIKWKHELDCNFEKKKNEERSILILNHAFLNCTHLHHSFTLVHLQGKDVLNWHSLLHTRYSHLNIINISVAEIPRIPTKALQPYIHIVFSLDVHTQNIHKRSFHYYWMYCMWQHENDLVSNRQRHQRWGFGQEGDRPSIWAYSVSWE